MGSGRRNILPTTAWISGGREANRGESVLVLEVKFMILVEISLKVIRLDFILIKLNDTNEIGDFLPGRSTFLNSFLK